VGAGTLAEILDELADTIRNVVSQVNDVDVQVEPRMVIDPTPPCIDMYPSTPSMDTGTEAFGDLIGGELVTVRVRVSTADSVAGQDLLLALMDDEDPLSLVSAITDEPSLNGLVSSMDLQGRTGYELYDAPQRHEGAWLGFRVFMVLIKARS